ncbi:MAG: hypothetical protein RL769_655, partial [Pseudomonadota bacterium]
KSCECYWLEGGDQILVMSKDLLSSVAMMVSFNYIKSLDPDGGHEWLEIRLKKLIMFLVKNKMHFLNQDTTAIKC